MAYILVALTIICTVYGQMILKWRVALIAPEGLSSGGGSILLRVLLDPWIISAFAAAFSAAVFWMAVLGRLPLSKAYPMTALTFPIIAALSIAFFDESLNLPKVVGTLLIVLGVAFIASSPS